MNDFINPRRKVLKRAVDALQKLTDDELDELFISMPPRVGKTTILMFFVTWLIGRNSELSNLYSAYSDTITKAFYNGVLEIINDPVTYLWHDVFPNAKLVQTNSQDETINIDRKKRYPSLTCRSLYGTLNGACDCNGFEISDDLIGGIEEALNKDRLVSAWSKVDNIADDENYDVLITLLGECADSKRQCDQAANQAIEAAESVEDTVNKTIGEEFTAHNADKNAHAGVFSRVTECRLFQI